MQRAVRGRALVVAGVAASLVGCIGGGDVVVADAGAGSALRNDASVPGGGGGSSGSTGSDPGHDGSGRTGGASCLFSEATAEISVANVDKVDLLFMVDNSGSMREEQELLRAQFPRLVQVLTSGDRDGDGVADFAPARDLHLGVVSSDMGLVGIQSIPGCTGLGDDGVMNNVPDPGQSGCDASYPRFLSYAAGVGDPLEIANDFGCIASLGTDGCGFEQPLEAGLKALWPSVDTDPWTGQIYEPNRIRFLGDVNGFGQLGHGDTDNDGFLRNNPAEGLSLVAIIMVTDEEDCSSADTRHFTPDIYLDPSDPLAMQDLNLRCFYNPQNLYSLDRYVNGFQALRPGNENLVVFGAIVGVPLDLIDGGVDMSNEVAREAYYERLLGDPRMTEQVDPDRGPEVGGNLLPSCLLDLDGDGLEEIRAYPARRFVELARRFGDNGSVQSICRDDFGPALDRIIEVISKQLGGVCLPRPLERQGDGAVPCDVLWELPPAPIASAGSPTTCDGLDFLSAYDAEPISSRGGQVCQVRQLPVLSSGEVAASEEGWFYDDYTAEVAHCPNGGGRISFTPGAHPPTGVTVKLNCLRVTPVDDAGSCDGAYGINTSARDVGSACLPDSVPEHGYDDREAYVQTNSEQCGGGACVVFRLRGDPRADCEDVPCAPTDPSCEGAVTCADPQEVRNRIYCSCRCDGEDGCGCPGDFSCVPLLESGPEEVRGSYCVRNGTFTQ